MLTAKNFTKATEENKMAQQVVKEIMPNADYILKGVDNQDLYFDVIVDKDKTTEQEIKDLKEKTRFATMGEDSTLYFISFRFSVSLH